jgi:hypothetical protein
MSHLAVVSVRQGGDGKVASGSLSTPANQFGGKAHAVVRFAESLISELGEKKGK